MRSRHEAVSVTEPGHYSEAPVGDTLADAIDTRIAEETSPCVTRQLTPIERGKYEKVHPNKYEIEKGARDGMTLEEVAEATDGSKDRAYHMARTYALLDKYRANAKAKGVAMYCPAEIRTLPPMPNTATPLAPLHDPPKAPSTVDVLQGLIELLDRMTAEPDAVDADASKQSGLYASFSRLVQRVMQPEIEKAAAQLTEYVEGSLSDVHASIASLAATCVKDRADVQRQLNEISEQQAALANRYRRHRHERSYTSAAIDEPDTEENDG